MARPPYNVEKARRLLHAWIAERIAKAPEDAPITVAAALVYLESRGLKAHRSTLYKHDLHAAIEDGERQQREDGGGRRIATERQEHAAEVKRLRLHIEELDQRNRTLLGEIARLRWNAKQNGLKEEEMQKSMPKPNRTQSKAGRGAQKQPSVS